MQFQSKAKYKIHIEKIIKITTIHKFLIGNLMIKLSCYKYIHLLIIKMLLRINKPIIS